VIHRQEERDYTRLEGRNKGLVRPVECEDKETDEEIGFKESQTLPHTHEGLDSRLSPPTPEIDVRNS